VNRRDFFRKAAVGAAVIAATPTILEQTTAYWPSGPFYARLGLSEAPAVVAEYSSYTYFSTLALEESIDEITANAAEQLGWSAGQALEAIGNIGI
jgi:hypothetical protein